MTVAVGSTLGGSYRLQRRIGGGAVGEVFEADHLRLARRVAVKVLRRALVDETHRARFREEAELASSIQHPGVAEVLDFNVSEEGQPYFVMPLLEGCDLAARIATAPRPSLPQAIEWGIQVASALSAIHAREIVHRDLKPSNIFLARTAAGEVARVLDFGIATALAPALEGSRPFAGSPAYMAPEQVMGGAVDGRADLFALGAILYELLAGRPPFGESDLEALHALQSAEVVPLRDLARVPEEISAVVHHALARRPEARYQCAQAFADDLKGALFYGR